MPTASQERYVFSQQGIVYSIGFWMWVQKNCWPFLLNAKWPYVHNPTSSFFQKESVFTWYLIQPSHNLNYYVPKLIFHFPLVLHVYISDGEFFLCVTQSI